MENLRENECLKWGKNKTIVITKTIFRPQSSLFKHQISDLNENNRKLALNVYIYISRKRECQFCNILRIRNKNNTKGVKTGSHWQQKQCESLICFPVFGSIIHFSLPKASCILTSLHYLLMFSQRVEFDSIFTKRDFLNY